MKKSNSNEDFISKMNLQEKVKCPHCHQHLCILFYGHQIQTCFEFDNKKIEKDNSPKLVLSFWCQDCKVEFDWILTQKRDGISNSVNFQIIPSHGIKKENLPQKRKSLPASLRYQILNRDNYTCQACGSNAEKGAILEVDHIYPASKGGSDAPENLRTLCRACNRGKGDKIYGHN